VFGKRAPWEIDGSLLKRLTAEVEMSTIVVRHTVKDFDAWKPYYDEHALTRERYGIWHKH
jgi:hypothetical protein